MKKNVIIFILGGILFFANYAGAFNLAVGVKLEMGGDFYRFDSYESSPSNFTQTNTNLIPVGIYPSAHLILGFDEGLLDVGVGFAGNITSVSIGGIARYFDTDFMKIGSGGEVVYFFMPASYPQGTYLSLNSRIVEVEFSLPVMPLTIHAGGGIKVPMVFRGDKTNPFSFALGWNVEAGARFYFLKD